MRERLAPLVPPPRWRPWAVAAALALHGLVIAFLLFAPHRREKEALQSPPGVSVVFENEGQKTPMAPPAPHPGPPQPAIAPPPPAPPPPPPPQPQAEVNLNMPDIPLAPMAELPAPSQLAPSKPAPPQQRQAAPARARTAPASKSSSQNYVMLNGMSYGNGSSGSPAPPVPQARPGLNLSLPETDAQAALKPDFSIKGDAGADWDAALTKWVNEHAYYPQAAAEQGQQGTAEVQFTVDRQGNVTNIHLVQSSGSNFLDLAWFHLFADNQLPPFPADAKSDHVTVDYTVHYILVGP